MAAAPAPHGTRSVEVVNDGAKVYPAPHGSSGKRGLIARGTRLPFVRRLPGRQGDFCTVGFWVEVGPSLYICERHVRYSREEPYGVTQPILAPGNLLPNDYVFVAYEGTRAYAQPSDFFVDDYAEAMGSGFGLVVTARDVYNGIPFVRTSRRLWVDEASIRRARGSDFEGYVIPDGALHFGWVKRRANLYARPNGRVVRRAGRREIIRFTPSSRRGWGETPDGQFVRLRDLHKAMPSEPPSDHREGEKWVDLDISEQVAIAYEGTTPVFATLVSSGRSGRNATPLGEHRVWVKLAYSDMDNLQYNRANTYAIEAVPWVQYFEGSNGIHAAFWHDQFGRRRSHGCINFSPRDARRIFSFTHPPLPDGWKAIFPGEEDRASIIRVRES